MAKVNEKSSEMVNYRRLVRKRCHPAGVYSYAPVFLYKDIAHSGLKLIYHTNKLYAV